MLEAKFADDPSVKLSFYNIIVQNLTASCLNLSYNLLVGNFNSYFFILPFVFGGTWETFRSGDYFFVVFVGADYSRGLWNYKIKQL